MQMNSIYFFIIFLFGILANTFVESIPCNRRNYQICHRRCIRRGGVRYCQQNRYGRLTVCRCRRN